MMTSIDLLNIISAINDKFGEDEFIEGHCLNLAVALHSALLSMGLKSQVVKIMRSDTYDFESDDGYDEKLSHVALYFDENQLELSSILLDKLTFDIKGDRAAINWPIQWNQVQMEIREPQEDFWTEIIEDADIEDFLEFAETEYGNANENKMINKPELRNEIKEFVLNYQL